MKYKVVIELDENRKSCINCPLLTPDDYCALQEESDNDSWDTLLSGCPLEPV